MGNDAWRVLLFYIDDDLHYNNYDVARIMGYFGLRVKPYQIKLWRLALTYESRRLVPEVAVLKALSPLRLLPKEETDECRTSQTSSTSHGSSSTLPSAS